MKAGISTISYAGINETEDALALIAESGAKTAEVYLSTFYEYRPEFARKYAENAKDLGICCVHANPQNFEPQLFSPSRRIRGDGLYWLDQVCRSAQLFGAEFVILHGFVRNGTDNRYDEWSGYINGVIDFCRPYGLKVALENVSFGIYNRPPVFAELKSRCADLYGVLDLKQAFASGVPYSEYLRDMSGAIAAVHLSDTDKRGTICLPGQGTVNFKKLFKDLKDMGFDGAVIIDADGVKDASEIVKSVKFVKDLIY